MLVVTKISLGMMAIVLSVTIVQAFVQNNKGYDYYFHTFLIKLIRSKGLSGLKKSVRTIRESTLYYPFLSHYLLSLIPEKFFNFVYKYINILIHVVIGYIVYLFCTENGFSQDLSIILTSIYICSPIFFTDIAVGPRLNCFTPRVLGELIGVIYYLCLYKYMMTGNSIELVFMSFIFSLSIFTGKMVVQAILLGTLMISILKLTFIIYIPLLCGTILIFLINKDISKALFRNHISIIMNFFKNKKVKRNTSVIKKIFFEANIFSMILKFPVFYFVTYILTSKCIIADNFNLLFVFTLSVAAIYFLVSTKYLQCVGHADRYIVNFIPFISLFLGRYSTQTQLYMSSIIIYSLALYYIFLSLFSATLIRRKRDDVNDVIMSINKIPNAINIASMPISVVGGWRILADTNHNWLYDEMSIWTNRRETKRYNQFLSRVDCLDIRRIKTLIKEYNLDLVIINKYQVPFFDWALLDDIKDFVVIEQKKIIYCIKKTYLQYMMPCKPVNN